MNSHLTDKEAETQNKGDLARKTSPTLDDAVKRDSHEAN